MQRKTDTFWITKYEIFYFWFFIPYCEPPQKQRVEGAAQVTWFKLALGPWWMAVLSRGQSGEPSAAPEI